MVNALRVFIILCVAALVLLYSSLANAQTNITYFKWTIQSDFFVGLYFDTQAEACAYMPGKTVSNGRVILTAAPSGSNRCDISTGPAPIQNSWINVGRISLTCPPDTIPDWPTRTCIADEPEPECPAAGTESTFRWAIGRVNEDGSSAGQNNYPSIGQQHSSDGCGFNVTDLVDCFSLEADAFPRPLYCTYTSEATGETSNAPPANDTPPPPPDQKQQCGPDEVTIGFDGSGNAICKPRPEEPDPCPAGMHRVEGASGAVTCKPNKGKDSEDDWPDLDPDDAPKTTTTTSKETTTNPDGSVTETTITTTTYPDGSRSVTTESVTTHPDGTTEKSSGTVNNGGQAGSGGTGSGSGSGGSGSGTGTGGEGSGDDKKDKPDNPVTPQGDLYQKGQKTFTQVFQAFNAEVNAAPFLQAANGFFTVQVGSAGCPSWSGTIPYINAEFNLGQYFCNGSLDTAMNMLKILLLLFASVAAFRMAFL